MTRTLALVALALTAFTAPSLADPAFTALPKPFETRNPPVVWKATAPDALTMTAGPKTNWFVSPWDAAADDTAPTLLFRPQKGNFDLEAKISLTPKSRWDSGALALYIDKDNWAKICFENSLGDGRLSVVMVTNRGVSDDSYTTMTADDNTMHLRVSRQGPAFVFFASHDGKNWTMLRDFRLDGDQTQLRAGLLAQSPTGSGITVTFSDIRYSTTP
jgi:regulation of enolase protein 1 (concanavalin A-like superfamily)